MTNEPSVRVGDILADKYRVERVLGVGGMGVVVAARNIQLGKPVAIKMMLPEVLAVPRAVERFEREARAAVQLKSEHVAEVLDIGKLANGAPYIVMELLEGNDFEGLLRRDHRLAIPEAVEYVLQAIEAIAEAHALGVVHRDLKPRNLFLTQRLDGTALVKVLDFGISKWTTAGSNHELTRTSDVIGSPNYMSPEQVRSAKDVDGRTDVWSLGVILYELLTGSVPFVAESLPQLCALVLERPAPSVLALRPDTPPELAAIIARCLEKSADARFQSVNALADALRPLAPAGPTRISARSQAAMSVASWPPGQRPQTPAPIPSSGARVHVGHGTSISWAETALVGKRTSRRYFGAALAVAIALPIAWFGMRHVIHHQPLEGVPPTGSIFGDAAIEAATPSPTATASLVVIDAADAGPVDADATDPGRPKPTTTRVSTTSVPHAPTGSPRATSATSSAVGPREPAATAGSGATVPPAKSAAGRADDPFTPSDRK